MLLAPTGPAPRVPSFRTAALDRRRLRRRVHGGSIRGGGALVTMGYGEHLQK